MARDIRDAREERQLPALRSPNAERPSTARRVHPAIYLTILGFALLFIASAWAFDGPGDTYYLLAIVSGFVAAAVGLPYQLWRVRRHGHDPRDTSLSHRSLWNWLRTDFDIWQTRVRGSDAAAAILLPVAAVSIGMFLLAIVLHIEIG